MQLEPCPHKQSSYTMSDDGEESSPASAAPTTRSKRLFVGQMAMETNDAALHKKMSEYGQVTDCIVMKDKMTGRSRCFGFVSLGSQEDVAAVLQAAGKEEGIVIDGRRIAITVADARPSEGGGGGGGGGGMKSGRDSRDVRDVRGNRRQNDSRDVRSSSSAAGGGGDIRDVRDQPKSQRSYLTDNDKSIIQPRHRGRGTSDSGIVDPRFPDDRGTDDAGVPLQRRKLFIGNVSHATTQQQYEEYFHQFGKIEDAVIIIDMPTGKRKGR